MFFFERAIVVGCNVSFAAFGPKAGCLARGQFPSGKAASVKLDSKGRTGHTFETIAASEDCRRFPATHSIESSVRSDSSTALPSHSRIGCAMTSSRRNSGRHHEAGCTIHPVHGGR